MHSCSNRFNTYLTLGPTTDDALGSNRSHAIYRASGQIPKMITLTLADVALTFYMDTLQAHAPSPRRPFKLDSTFIVV